LGHHHTEEAKEKNRQAHLGKPSPRKGTGIIVTKICPNCNAEFVRPVGWANKVACCSTKCGYTYRSKRIR
jgi:hypothetical protein